MRFEEVANAHYKNLNENDRYILRRICADKEACRNLPIQGLADHCNVSRTTILRFAQKLGFEGYSAMKAFLAFEAQEIPQEETRDMTACLYADMEALREQVAPERTAPVCRLMAAASRIFVYGTGATQKEIAKEMQRMFMSLHKYLNLIDGEAELQNLLADLQPQDMLLLISFSGENAFLQDMVQKLAIRGVPYISMTSLSENFLAQHAKLALYIPITPVKTLQGEYYSTVLFFVAVDILMRRYIEYDRDMKQKDGSKYET